MRLGLLGPANGDLAGLARCAEFLLNGAKVTRAIYLGMDDALEDTVSLWAESLVGPDPSDEGIWERALAMLGAGGSPDQIDAFLRAERARLRLKSLERLPTAELRTVEMFCDRVAVLIHDKALLDEEDIFSATFLVYGKSDAPLVKRIGPRWFLTPGPIGCAGGGSAVLDDTGDEVLATIYDGDGRASHSETLTVRRMAKLSVQR
ncbi:MAG: hypothetical protein JOZ69_21845 [Myxococcales bacterium]|nr:hypothetical protein [Myxococcales bacterium]